MTTQQGFNVLITGGSGFLGSFIVRDLLAADSPLQVNQLKILDLRPPEGIDDPRVTYIRGDVRDREIVGAACANTDLVFHTAAIVDWGTRPEEEVTSINYGGTKNVLEACLEQGVKAMVYTSTLDVLYNGGPHVDINEDHPYPEQHANAYCRSKYLGEVLVREANGERIQTTVIRPTDIWGEGDPYHIGSLINMAKGGFYVRLGNGKAKCQPVYVGNMSRAHLLAGKALLDGNEKVAGSVYFITDAPAINFFRLFDQVVIGAGYRIRPKNLWIPRGFAMALGAASEAIAFLVRPVKKYYPKLSRFAVIYTCTDYTIRSDRAAEDFGFVPQYSRDEAMKRTTRFYAEAKG